MSAVEEYKCPSCGAPMEFDSTVQKMKCPYCGTELEMDEVEKTDKKDDSQIWQNASGSEWAQGETDGMNIYSCQSCGGEIVAGDLTGAMSCPYCGNQIVFKQQFAGDLRPDAIIPFKLSKKDAKAAYLKHLEGKKFLPKVFRDENHIDEMKGIYVPFWVFDVKANANVLYHGNKIRTWSDSHYDYTETNHFNILRSGSVCFEKVPVDGSSKMPDDLMESIEPFRYSEAVDFQPAFLAGYLADRYDVPMEQCIGHAKERIKKSTEDTFRNTVKGYSSVVTARSHIDTQQAEYRYVLYPVWLLNTTWNGEKYTFAMNGQTGKLVGDLPLDKQAYWRCFGKLTLISGVIVYALRWLFQLL